VVVNHYSTKKWQKCSVTHEDQPSWKIFAPLWVFWGGATKTLKKKNKKKSQK
jgi:hypothetical protein